VVALFVVGLFVFRDWLFSLFGWEPIAPSSSLIAAAPVYLPPPDLQPYVRRGVPGGAIEIIIPRHGGAEVVLIQTDAAEDMAWQILQWRAADRRRAQQARHTR